MPAHPERLAAFAVLGAVALSLLLGVAWRDQIACGLVEASGLTSIGPKIFADAPADAQETALLLDLARESRRRAAVQGAGEAVLVFSGSNFWRGDEDARIIHAPFRACVVIGPQARGLERIAGEMAKLGPTPRDAPKAPAAATPPASELAPRAGQTATAAKPGEAAPAPGPTAVASSTPAAAPAQDKSALSQGAEQARKAPDFSVAAAPDLAGKAAQPPVARPSATPHGGEALAPSTPDTGASPPIQTGPARQPDSSAFAPPAKSTPTNAEESAPQTAATERAPVAPSSQTQAPTPSALKTAPAAQVGGPSARPRPIRLTGRPQTPDETVSSFNAPRAMLTPRSRVGAGRQAEAPLPASSAPLVARHIRPTQSRAVRAPLASWLAPAPPIVPARAAQAPMPTPRLPAPPHSFAAPSLWDAWARRDPLARAPSLRRMDRVGGLLYQARDPGNETLCSTDSTNGYCRCRRAATRRWR